MAAIRRPTTVAERLLEALDDADIDLPATRGEGQDREGVATGLDAAGECRERLLLDVEHPSALDPAVGGQGGIDQEGDGEIARPAAGVEVDGVAAAPAGRKVDARADQGVGVELVAVELGAQDLAPGPQRLELASHAADLAPARLVRLPVVALLGCCRGEHAHSAAAGRPVAGSPTPGR